MYAASGGTLTLNSTLVGMNNNTIIMYRDNDPRGRFMPHSATNPLGYTSAEEAQERGQALLARAVAAVDGSTLLNGLTLNTITPSQVDSVTFVITGDPGA